MHKIETHTTCIYIELILLISDKHVQSLLSSLKPFTVNAQWLAEKEASSIAHLGKIEL